jgi:hypothetical protein
MIRSHILYPIELRVPREVEKASVAKGEVKTPRLRMTNDKLMDGLEKRKGAGEKGVTSDRPAPTVNDAFGG